MPELPEVETMRRGVFPVVGGRIDALQFPSCHLKPITVRPSRRVLSRRLPGRTIQGVDRLGKRLLFRLEGEQILVIEPRMTGLVLLANPPDETHLRVGWGLSGVSVPWLWFWDRRGLGTVQLLSACEFADRYGPDRVGPDALQLGQGQLRDRLRTSRREVKVALLDQRSIAGIGNLYASEVLHVARIHPRKRCHRLTRSEWQRLQEAIRHVLLDAVRYEGSTLGDGTYRNALNRPGTYQNHHRVYARAGQPCPRCRLQPVERFVQAQRATFWCPRCQPR